MSPLHVKLPKFDPDSLELPEIKEPKTGDQLSKRYGISKAQFYNRKNALPFVQGFKHGKRVLFSITECYQLDACHFYITNGFSLSDVAEAYKDWEPELVDDSVYEVENLDKVEDEEQNKSNSSALSEIDPSIKDFSNDLAKHVVAAVEKVAPRQLHDPLRSFRLLKEAAEDRYVLSSKMLAEVLELKPATIFKFGDVEERLGFRFSKTGKGLWRIERLKDEEV